MAYFNLQVFFIIFLPCVAINVVGLGGHKNQQVVHGQTGIKDGNDKGTRAVNQDMEHNPIGGSQGSLTDDGNRIGIRYMSSGIVDIREQRHPMITEFEHGFEPKKPFSLNLILMGVLGGCCVLICVCRVCMWVYDTIMKLRRRRRSVHFVPPENLQVMGESIL